MCACTSDLLFLLAKEEEGDVDICTFFFKWIPYVDAVEGHTLSDTVCVTSHVSVKCVSPGHVLGFAASGKAAGTSISLGKRPPALKARLQHSGRRNPQLPSCWEEQAPITSLTR